MMNKFFRWLVPKLENWCEKKGRVLYITGKQGPEDVYLIRYFLFRTKYLSCYIHRFLRSDIDDPHDHPFHFLGYVVSGGYKEIRYDNATAEDQSETTYLLEWEEVRMVGKWGWRNAHNTIHKVLVDKPRTLAEKKDAPLTFILRGPYIRDWFFYKMSDEVLTSRLGQLRFGQATPVLWWKYLGLEGPHSRE